MPDNNETLSVPLIDFAQDGTQWTIGNAVEGTVIFGGTGSGKTTGSADLIIRKYLEHDFGGLVLTVKPDERKRWVEYCKKAKRLDDLVIIEEGGNNTFDFLAYISRNGRTENILHVLKTVIQASEEKSHGTRQDAFWENALDMLIGNVIDLCLLATGTVTVRAMYDIVQSLPRREEGLSEETVFGRMARQAAARVNAKIEVWEKTQPASYVETLTGSDHYEDVILAHVPEARLLRMVETYFTKTYANLAEKTRSIIDFSFSGFLLPLLRDPFYSLFCQTGVDTPPDLSAKGKIILLNLPVKTMHKVGRDIQIMYKFLWQRAMEDRRQAGVQKPVFLLCDEAQHFLHEHDAEFQATARSSLIATVYITQSLASFYANMGGDRVDYRVRVLMTTLSTKIFHANNDAYTNYFASDLFGDALLTNESWTVHVGEAGSASKSISKAFETDVRPSQFAALKTGGARFKYKVQAFIHVQGMVFANNSNHALVRFQQSFNRNPPDEKTDFQPVDP